MDVIFQVLLDQSCSPGKFHHREVELSWQDRIHTKDTAHAFQLLACVVSSHTCDRKKVILPPFKIHNQLTSYPSSQEGGLSYQLPL